MDALTIYFSCILILNFDDVGGIYGGLELDTMEEFLLIHCSLQ